MPSVGEKANIGAGTITCNYDGFGKYRTEIGAGAFIGSNSALVAPVSIGDGAIVGAGSVVTKNVAADELAIARGEQKRICRLGRPLPDAPAGEEGQAVACAELSGSSAARRSRSACSTG